MALSSNPWRCHDTNQQKHHRGKGSQNEGRNRRAAAMWFCDLCRGQKHARKKKRRSFKIRCRVFACFGTISSVVLIFLMPHIVVSHFLVSLVLYQIQIQWNKPTTIPISVRNETVFFSCCFGAPQDHQIFFFFFLRITRPSYSAAHHVQFT